MAVITSLVRATVKVRNGALSSVRRESAPATVRVRENTSNGPAKSSTSTSSKIRIPTLMRASSLMPRPLRPSDPPAPPAPLAHPDQLPVFDPVRLIGRRAEPAFAVRLVVLIVPREPHHRAVALEREH